MSRWGLLLWCGPALFGPAGCVTTGSQCHCTPPPPPATAGTETAARPAAGQPTRSAKPSAERPEVVPTAAQEPAADALPQPRAVAPPLPNAYPVGPPVGGPPLPANPLPVPTAAGALLTLGPHE